MNREDLLKKAYDLFNARKADELLQLMTPDVRWPNGWEGGYVNGREEVKAYWTRQWKEIDPHVEPRSFKHTNGNEVEVLVAQTVKDLQGNLLSHGEVKHLYTFDGTVVSEMQIVAAE